MLNKVELLIQNVCFNGDHSLKFTQQVSLEYQRWLAERFISREVKNKIRISDQWLGTNNTNSLLKEFIYFFLSIKLLTYKFSTIVKQNIKNNLLCRNGVKMTAIFFFFFVKIKMYSLIYKGR